MRLVPSAAWSALYTAAGIVALAGVLLSPSTPTVVLFGSVMVTAFALLCSRSPLVAGVTWVVLSPALYPFVRYPRSGSLLTFDRMYLSALVLALLMRRSGRRPSAPSVRAFAVAVVVFAALFLIRAVTTHPHVVSAVETFIDAVLLPCAAFFICRRTADTPRKLRMWAAGLMVSGTLVAVLGVTERYFGYELASLSGGAVRVDSEAGGLVRVSGPYSVPEVYALTLALTLAATLFWWMSGRTHGTRSRVLPSVVGPVLATVQLAGLIVSLFRVAWACAPVILVIGLGLRVGHRLRLAAVGLAVALAVLVLFVPLQDNAVFRTRMGNTDNVAGRLATYQVGVEIWRSAPLTGVGINRFVDAQSRVQAREVWGVRSVKSPHSSFIASLAEQGAAGFTALIAVCAFCARMLRRLGRLAPRDPTHQVLRAAVMAGVLSYLAFSLELTMLPYGPSNIALAVLLGLSAAAIENAGPLGAERRTRTAAGRAAGTPLAKPAS
ncbi:O-antigen ligase family protein [Streptomyces sp. NPDC093984]|uniref:O-antigen ligase family protein n=1 Tax=Streptomyces sp. NPDC093984 TaxID=3366052 RepID=UPI003808ADFD